MLWGVIPVVCEDFLIKRNDNTTVNPIMGAVVYRSYCCLIEICWLVN